MMDAHPCPACGGDSDSCYCPGVPLTSPAEGACPPPGAATPRPAVAPPATGDNAAEWRTPRPDLRWPHTSAMVSEAPTPRYWLPYQGYATTLLQAGDVLERVWAAMYPAPDPAAYPLDPVTGRVTVGTGVPE